MAGKSGLGPFRALGSELISVETGGVMLVATVVLAPGTDRVTGGLRRGVLGTITPLVGSASSRCHH